MPIDLLKPDALLRLTHMDTDGRVYHQENERAFFEWVERIPCVLSYRGEGALGLVVRRKRRPGNDDLRQLLACRSLLWMSGMGRKRP